MRLNGGDQCKRAGPEAGGSLRDGRTISWFLSMLRHFVGGKRKAFPLRGGTPAFQPDCLRKSMHCVRRVLALLAFEMVLHVSLCFTGGKQTVRSGLKKNFCSLNVLNWLLNCPLNKSFCEWN